MGHETEIKTGHDKWVEEYERWRGGDETQREYCLKRGMTLHEFKTGISEAKKAGLLGASKQSSGFVPVQVIDNVTEPVVITEAPYCEILFSGKPGIRIETEGSIATLKLLLNNLR